MSIEKETQAENYYDERNTAEDSIKSSHSELQRSTEYANEELYPLEKLKELAYEWGEEANNPNRSERSRKVCRMISLRATLECACILNNVALMTECYRAMNEQALAA